MPTDQERLDRMIAMRREGKTVQQIADAEGITKQRVSQLLPKGLPGGKDLPPRGSDTDTPFKRLLRECNLTLRGMAERTGCSYDTVKQLASGAYSPRVSVAREMAQVFSEIMRRPVSIEECFCMTEADINGESHD